MVTTLTTTPTNTDITWARQAFDGKRANRYARYARYLDGDQPLELASAKFDAAFGDRFKAFAYNRCPVVVDAHADQMQVVGFEVDGDEESADEVTAAQAVQNLWDSNQMQVRAGHVHAELFGQGDSYVLVDKDPVTGAVQFWPQRAADIRVRWSETEAGVLSMAAKRWTDAEGYNRLNLYYRDRIEKYRGSRTITTIDHDGAMQMIFGAEGWTRYQGPNDVTWPVMLDVTDTVPIFHFANNARLNEYGRSELADVLALQDGINKACADLMVAEEFAAYAQRVLLNVDVDDPDAAAAVNRFQLGIDRLLALAGSGDGNPPSIAEFSAAQMAQFELVIELFERMISRVTKVPLHYLTMAGNFSSGRAMRLAMTSWIAKIIDRQAECGEVWGEALRYGMRLLGADMSAGAITVKWASAAPMAEEDKWDIALQQRAVGLPLETVLADMGWDADRIETATGQLAAAADRARQQFARGDVPIATDAGGDA